MLTVHTFTLTHSHLNVSVQYKQLKHVCVLFDMVDLFVKNINNMFQLFNLLKSRL